MKLMTKAIERKLPALNATDGQNYEAVAQVKFFTPWTQWTWYATEYDPATRQFFGLVDGLERELGYFNLGELEEIVGPLGLKIERDLYFPPTKLQDIK